MKQYIQENKERFFEELFSLLRIPSVSSLEQHKPDMVACAERLVVDTAIENKLGARGLRSICERIMTDAMYDAPSTDEPVFNLTVEYAKSKL